MRIKSDIITDKIFIYYIYYNRLRTLVSGINELNEVISSKFMIWTPALWSSEFERSIWGTFSLFHFLFRISVEEFEFYNHFSCYQEFNKTLEVFKAKPKKLCILKFWFSALFPDGYSIKLVLWRSLPFPRKIFSVF